MRADRTDAYREWAAVYVLGSLDPHERREFEKHMVECSNCAAAASEFGAVPALLSRLPAAEALALGRSGGWPVGPPDFLKTLADRMNDRVGHRQHKTRP